MKNLKEVLKNPFDGLLSDDVKGFQYKCLEIAQELFNNYCIKCKDSKFFFAEIEFYYYEKGRWEKEWNKVTYARKGYKAGELFYHLSGIDICFESHYGDDYAKFGGILIRAIKNEEGFVIAGPLNCKDEILNACKCGEMAQLELSSLKHNILQLKSTYRALGKDDMDKENDRLCFYDGQIIDWAPKIERYNTKNGKMETRKGSYKTDRFNP